MKIKITLKDPDGVSESIRNAIEQQVEQIEGISEEERDELVYSRTQELEESLKPWIEYGEYLTVEFDTDARTATVIKK